MLLSEVRGLVSWIYGLRSEILRNLTYDYNKRCNQTT